MESLVLVAATSRRIFSEPSRECAKYWSDEYPCQFGFICHMTSERVARINTLSFLVFLQDTRWDEAIRGVR
jgi:hypothetical protein